MELKKVLKRSVAILGVSTLLISGLALASNNTPAGMFKTAAVSIETIARQVINGKFGNGAARKRALVKGGYNYQIVQGKVNNLLGITPIRAQKRGTVYKKSSVVKTKRISDKSIQRGNKNIEDAAKRVLNGKYGNYPRRKVLLERDGFSYSAVQKEVQRMLNARLGLNRARKATTTNTRKATTTNMRKVSNNKKTTTSVGYLRNSLYVNGKRVARLVDSGSRPGMYDRKVSHIQAIIDNNQYAYSGKKLSVNDGESNRIYYHWYLDKPSRWWQIGKRITIVDDAGQKRDYKMVDKIIKKYGAGYIYNSKWHKSLEGTNGYESIFIQTCLTGADNSDIVIQEYRPVN